MKFTESRTKANNRKKLTDSAFSLFIEKGIAATSIKEIMENASMERKTFYTFFKTKEDLAEYIFYDVLTRTYTFDVSYDEHASGYEKIEHFLHAYIDHLLNLRDELKFTVQYDTYFKDVANTSFMIELFKLNQDSSMDRVLEIAKEGIEDGSINLSENYKMEIILMSHSVYALAQRMVFREPILREEITGMIGQEFTYYDVKDVMNIILRGLKK